MTTGEDQIIAQLQTEFGHRWTISRTYLGDNRNRRGSWKATRTRQLSFREMEKGLSQSLIEDTAAKLRAELAKQADKQDRLADFSPAYMR